MRTDSQTVSSVDQAQEVETIVQQMHDGAFALDGGVPMVACRTECLIVQKGKNHRLQLEKPSSVTHMEISSSGLLSEPQVFPNLEDGLISQMKAHEAGEHNGHVFPIPFLSAMDDRLLVSSAEVYWKGEPTGSGYNRKAPARMKMPNGLISLQIDPGQAVDAVNIAAAISAAVQAPFLASPNCFSEITPIPECRIPLRAKLQESSAFQSPKDWVRNLEECIGAYLNVDGLDQQLILQDSKLCLVDTLNGASLPHLNVAKGVLFSGLLSYYLEHDPKMWTSFGRHNVCRDNLTELSREGLKAEVSWQGEQRYISPMLLEELIPKAEQGLTHFPECGAEQYFAQIKHIVSTGRTLGDWMLKKTEHYIHVGRSRRAACLLVAEHLFHNRFKLLSSLC